MGRQATMNSLCRRHPPPPFHLPPCFMLALHTRASTSRPQGTLRVQCRWDPLSFLWLVTYFSHSHAHSHTHSHSGTLTHTLTYFHILTHTVKHALTLTHTNAFSSGFGGGIKGQPGLVPSGHRSITLHTWLLCVCVRAHTRLLSLYKNVDNTQQFLIQLLKGNDWGWPGWRRKGSPRSHGSWAEKTGRTAAMTVPSQNHADRSGHGGVQGWMVARYSCKFRIFTCSSLRPGRCRWCIRSVLTIEKNGCFWDLLASYPSRAPGGPMPSHMGPGEIKGQPG